MLTSAKSKLLLALLGVAFLLFNPAGFCTDDMTAQAGHPCCPKAPVSVKSACLCIDRHQAAPTVAAPVPNASAVVALNVALPAIEFVGSFTDAVSYSPPERFLAFHQILV